MQFVLLLGLGVVAFFMFKQAFGGGYQKGDRQLPEKNLAHLTVKDARVGDVISIAGAGDDFEDLSFDVERRNRYESGGEAWYELAGRYKGRHVYLEWYDDDMLECVLNRGKELFLDELGISEDDLARFDAEQTRSNFVEYEGQKFRYDGSHEIGYFKDGRGDGEGFYNWDFVSEDKSLIISVEKWEGDPFEVSLNEKLNPDKITVFRK